MNNNSINFNFLVGLFFGLALDSFLEKDNFLVLFLIIFSGFLTMFLIIGIFSTEKRKQVISIAESCILGFFTYLATDAYNTIQITYLKNIAIEEIILTLVYINIYQYYKNNFFTIP